MTLKALRSIKIYGTIAVVVIGVGYISFQWGCKHSEKQFKPIIDDLSTRVKKLEKRRSKV